MKHIAKYLVASLCLLSACGGAKEEKVATFSEETPYTIEIKKERSYFQAEKIANRLNKMGLGGYVVKSEQEDGTWYRVLSGALKDSAEANSYIAKLDTSFNIQNVVLVNYTTTDSISKIPVTKTDVKDEVQRIDANKPAVPQSVSAVVGQFPVNNSFMLKSVSLFTLTGNGIKMSKTGKVDMPRGIKLDFLKKKGCQSFCTAIYTDNIYGNDVTFQVVKLKDKVQTHQAAMMPSFNEDNEDAVKLCDEVSDLILNTGNYEGESKDVFEHNGMSGFKVSFTDKGKHRTYYIFTDVKGEFLYMAQSDTDNDEEIKDLISEIGKSNGLEMYDEFYNSYYTALDELFDRDEFIGCFLSRLTDEYARVRDYAPWAKKMVGLWTVTNIYDNSNKGIWYYQIFDMVNNTKGKLVYNELYYSDLKKEDKRTIYGVDGAALYYDLYFMKYLKEINFGTGRYVVAASGDMNFDEKELIDRCEKIQLTKGGYDCNTPVVY